MKNLLLVILSVFVVGLTILLYHYMSITYKCRCPSCDELRSVLT